MSTFCFAQRRAGANMAFWVHNERLLKFINSFDSPSSGEGFGCKTTKKKQHRKMQNVRQALPRRTDKDLLILLGLRH
jgi:hypothetical protein